MTPVAYSFSALFLPIPDALEWKKGRIIKSEWSVLQKIQYRAGKILYFLGNVALLPLVTTMNLASRILERFNPAGTKIIKTPYPADLATALPPYFGFADSFLQSSGLGTWASATALKGRSDWSPWLKPEHIEGPKTYRECFVEILKNPAPFIEVLKKLNVTAHRFSLEWAVIEPEPGKLDAEAIYLYRNFIQELKNGGIEPYVTLHHFVQPEWAGDFEQLENIDPFVSYSIKMMELFPEVKEWMTFNEPGVYALQSRIRGVFPPGKQGDFSGAAHVIRNMLIAHCKIYNEAKLRFGDKVQIGITHQWLNFEPMEGNALERIVCYFYAKITHYCVYNFFKTGRFDFDIPLKANVQFSISEKEFAKNNQFLDFIGVQFYGYPRIKAGFNGGEKYPGYKTVNFPIGQTGVTFGSTCPKGGKVTSFGLSFYPESLQSCLTEAAALKKPIAITETGCDARVQKWGDQEFRIDNETQKEYFLKIAPILHRFKDQIKAFFVWTLYRGHLEWDRGQYPALGVVKLTKDKDRNITGFETTPASLYLQKSFQTAQAQMA